MKMKNDVQKPWILTVEYPLHFSFPSNSSNKNLWRDVKRLFVKFICPNKYGYKWDIGYYKEPVDALIRLYKRPIALQLIHDTPNPFYLQYSVVKFYLTHAETGERIELMTLDRDYEYSTIKEPWVLSDVVSVEERARVFESRTIINSPIDWWEFTK